MYALITKFVNDCLEGGIDADLIKMLDQGSTRMAKLKQTQRYCSIAIHLRLVCFIVLYT